MLDNAVRNNVLDALNGTTTFNAPTTPIKVRLMTANGTATSNGTELAASGGYAAGGATVTFAAASAGATNATGTVRWDNMPAATIVGVELWDSSGSPRRIQLGALTANKTVGAGDSFELPAASLSEALA